MTDDKTSGNLHDHTRPPISTAWNEFSMARMSTTSNLKQTTYLQQQQPISRVAGVSEKMSIH
jgi:hypothetical protein